MLPRIGTTEILVILFLALLIFGPRQLPKLGRSIGESLRSMKTTRKEFEEGLKATENDINKIL